MALQSRALNEGLDEGQIEAAMEAGDPKAQLVGLIVAKRVCAVNAESTQVAALREELQGLTLMKLQKRALAEGIGEEALEQACDQIDPKQAVIALLMERVVPEGVPPTRAR